MSLESTIADLVTAANNLTGAVNGKMASIDAKVNAATTELENKFATLARKIYYIDGVSGSDANDGLSFAKPMKTLAKAYEALKLTSAAVINIYFIRSGVYVLPADASGAGKTRKIYLSANGAGDTTQVYPDGLNVTLRVEGGYSYVNTDTEISYVNIQMASTTYGLLCADGVRLRVFRAKVIKSSGVTHFVSNYSNPAGLNFATFQETTFDGGGATYNPVGKLQGTTMWKHVGVTLQNGAALNAAYTTVADLYVF